MEKTITTKEYANFIKKLRKAREDAGLKQIDVAKKLKRPQSYISRVESGEYRVDVLEMKKFAEIYKKDINYFFEMKQQKGFIQIPILIAIIVVASIIGGGVYISVKKYTEKKQDSVSNIPLATTTEMNIIQNNEREQENSTTTDESELEKLKKEIEELKKQSSSLQLQAQQATKKQETSINNISKKKGVLSNAEIIKKVGPAVVFIETYSSKGTGMFIESTGFVLTNAHVVTGVSIVKIRVSDSRTLIASVVGRDEKVDLAILKVDGDNFPKIEFGDSDKIVQGDEVFALGYPFGIEGDVSFKEGTISRKISDGEFVFLETSAEIHPGNSGGPLVNQYGQVVGINTAILGENIKGIVIGEAIKFAIPINIAKIHIPELKNGRVVLLPLDSRKVEYEEFKKFKNEYLIILSDAFSFYDLQSEATIDFIDGNYYAALKRTEQVINILDVAIKKLSVIKVPKLPFSQVAEDMVQLQLDVFARDKTINEGYKLKYDFFLNSPFLEYEKLEFWKNSKAAQEVEKYIEKTQIEQEPDSSQLSLKTKQFTQNADEYFK